MASIFSKDFLLFGKNFHPEKDSNFNSSSPSRQFWDPITVSRTDDVNGNVAHLQWRTKQLTQHASRIKYIRAISLIASISVGIWLLFFTPVGLQLASFAVIILALPFIGIKRLLRDIKTDIIKFEIAKESNWLYDPTPNSLVGRNLMTKFSEILKSGNCGEQSVDDQFWGVKKVGSRSYSFYSGLYSYAQERRSSKSRSKTTYRNYFFCFKLPKKLKSQFLLSPENGFSNWFSSKEINVESIAFNKTFSFSYNGSKGEQAINIVRSLSPSVQESLVRISKVKRGLSILFKDNVVLFSFPGRILSNPQSKVLGGVDLSQADVDDVKYYLDAYVDVFTEIAKYLE